MKDYNILDKKDLAELMMLHTVNELMNENHVYNILFSINEWLNNSNTNTILTNGEIREPLKVFENNNGYEIEFIIKEDNSVKLVTDNDIIRCRFMDSILYEYIINGNSNKFRSIVSNKLNSCMKNVKKYGLSISNMDLLNAVVIVEATIISISFYKKDCNISASFSYSNVFESFTIEKSKIEEDSNGYNNIVFYTVYDIKSRRTELLPIKPIKYVYIKDHITM